MSSEAGAARRGPRKSKIKATNPLEPANRRNGRPKGAPQRRPSVRPGRTATKAPHPRLAWYAGLALMAIIEIIEWRMAIVMMLGHEVAHRTHTQALRDFAEGIEAGA